MKFESMIDRPILNSKDAADDLLVRIMLRDRDVSKQRIRNMKNLFQSAGIICWMIETNHVSEKTNNEVYDLYFYMASELDIPIISKDFLMKALKFYYGFEIISVRQGTKIVRILKESDNDYFISHQKTKDFLDKLNRSELVGRITSEVFLEYKEWCLENGVPSITSPGFFSKLVIASKGVKVKSKRIGTKVVRVFSE